MTLPALHFVHGNSFPSATYNEFLKYLRPQYSIQALAMHAHDPRYPVTDGWPELREELINALLERYKEPVILVGHSMGGMLSLMAAHARPDLVRCVVLLDAPVVAGWRAMLWRFVKARGKPGRWSPARFSQARRNLWPDQEAVYAHFAAKPMFAIWPEQVLRDYVEAGTRPHPEGVTLAFERDVETAVYNTLPHHVGQLARPPFPVPIGFVGGIDSAECRMAGLAATKKLVGKRFVQLPGGHLLTMERPRETAGATLAMIRALLEEG